MIFLNQMNETIRILRIQIEAERKQANPNWERVEKLSHELNELLEGADIK